jgi:predicted ArsR family transcriptional regulator
LEYLKRRGSGSVADLSRGLGLTPVTIRHHLEALVADRLVAEPSPRRRPGPGRPEMAYRLTSAADPFLPRNYGELCACLADALAAEPGPHTEGFLAGAGAALGRTQGVKAGTSPGERRGALMAILERRGYLPAWQIERESQYVVLSNCPYLEVSRQTPGICHFDLGLIQAVLGTEVCLDSSIAAHEATCRFRVDAPV